MFFVEGVFRLNNQMLSDLRAAGHYEGYGQAMVDSRQWRHRKKGRDLFAEEVQAIRLAVKASIRGTLAKVGAPWRLNVTVMVVGHWKHDPDAWTLLGKAAVDGLVDAGVVASDRRSVGIVAGRVCTSEADQLPTFAVADEIMGPHAPRSLCKGFFLILEPVEVPHA